MSDNNRDDYDETKFTEEEIKKFEKEILYIICENIIYKIGKEYQSEKQQNPIQNTKGKT